MRKRLAVLIGATFLSCATIKPELYTNEFINSQHNLYEIGRTGTLPNTQKVFISGNDLFIRTESFAFNSDKEALKDAYEGMQLTVGQLTKKPELGKYAHLAFEEYVNVEDKKNNEKVVAEVIYAIPLNVFDYKTKKNLVKRYPPKDLKSANKEILNMLKKEFYSNPAMEDSMEVVGVEGYVDENNPVYIKDNKLYIVGFSKPYDDMEKAKYSSSEYVSSMFERLAGKINLYKIKNEKKELRKLRSPDGKRYFALENLCSFDLSQFKQNIQKKIKDNVQ